ncbi:MAG TPA: ethylbenzene dehydrogenase-related protein [Chitinophagales bacterium]|nr:ethylbenzene dehydrogenase-related protein [Chitinophagales bacterium]
MVIFFMLIYLVACRNDFYPEPPPPKVPVATSTLEAEYVAAPPITLSSSYWKTADYLNVTAEDVATGMLYGDGYLNMTGIFSGMNAFNAGDDPQITMKAAYDADNLYIVAEWYDSELDVSEANWFWNGPPDVLKSDSTNGWTSQKNNDKLAMAFEIDPASSAFGSFSNVGCAASCHSNGPNSNMLPDLGKVDIWNWKLAHTSPLGYAQDMVSSANGFVNDAGQPMYVRNTSGASSRSGPAYEWSGVSQTITLSNGTQSILDPSCYLYNKAAFTGDAARGDSIYHVEANGQPGHCNSCHGEHGEGGVASLINTPFLNTKSRATLIDNMDNVSDMAPYWLPLTASEKDDLIAYIRGLSGVPGYYLATPDGSSADVAAVSNVTPIDIRNAITLSTNVHTKYQVLIIRKLKTNNADDVQFDPAVHQSYLFGIALMDNDGKNHIGSTLETLTFK